jgi:transposase
MPNRKKSKSKKTAKRRKNPGLPASLECVNLNAAGIDIGSSEHWVAVGEDRDEQPVRKFEAFTADLYRLADWLKECGIDTVVMESTGVYWIPLFQILEERGFEVKLVNAKHVKNVSGRKSDILDCQWLQQLHTFGLLSGSFRPEDDICILRSYLRHRDNLVRQCSSAVQHIQKALTQMNILLYKVISDIVGLTGMRIIRAILEGERDGKKLAQMKDYRVKSSANTISKSLQGDYREEHLFVLKQSVELYDFYHKQLDELDLKITAQIGSFEPKVDIELKPMPELKKGRKKPKENSPKVDWRSAIYKMAGVDLTQIPGIDTLTTQILISEIGVDMSLWKSEKHFASWLGLSPNNRISGGKILSSRTRKSVNRAAQALRMAASTLNKSKTALGAFFRRKRAQHGSAKAITATAHKLAKIVYQMLKTGKEFLELGEQYYEQKYKQRVIKSLQKRAKSLGLAVVPIQQLTATVS